jgi:signal transduction histidine kinase
LSAFGDISSQGFSGQLSNQSRNVVAGTIGVIHDITRYKLMETQLKEAIGNMEKESLKRKEAEKTFEQDRGELMKQSNELETFAYRVAHDLKSPLLFLRSLIELFRSGDVDKDQVLEKLDRGLNRSLSLVNGLYNLGRLKRKDHSWGNISLVEMVKEVSEWLEADMRIKKINLNIDCPDVVFAIEDVLPLVFLNLISNALKYNLSENPQIRITSRPDEDKILVKVEDNGPGLPVTAEKKIFEAFVQLGKSRLKEGLGVGLNTVCNALLLHGSQVWVSRSKDLGGACLSFKLTPAQKSSQEISDFMEES